MLLHLRTRTAADRRAIIDSGEMQGAYRQLRGIATSHAGFYRLIESVGEAPCERGIAKRSSPGRRRCVFVRVGEPGPSRRRIATVPRAAAALAGLLGCSRWRSRLHGGRIAAVVAVKGNRLVNEGGETIGCSGWTAPVPSTSASAAAGLRRPGGRSLCGGDRLLARRTPCGCRSTRTAGWASTASPRRRRARLPERDRAVRADAAGPRDRRDPRPPLGGPGRPPGGRQWPMADAEHAPEFWTLSPAPSASDHGVDLRPLQRALHSVVVVLAGRV